MAILCASMLGVGCCCCDRSNEYRFTHVIRLSCRKKTFAVPPLATATLSSGESNENRCRLDGALPFFELAVGAFSRLSTRTNDAGHAYTCTKKRPSTEDERSSLQSSTTLGANESSSCRALKKKFWERKKSFTSPRTLYTLTRRWRQHVHLYMYACSVCVCVCVMCVKGSCS